MNPEMKQTDQLSSKEKQEQIQQQQIQSLQDGVQDLASKQPDPEKQKLMPQLSNKILTTFLSQTGYPLSQLQKTNPQT